MQSRRARVAAVIGTYAVVTLFLALTTSRPGLAIVAGLCGVLAGVSSSAQTRPPRRLYLLPAAVAIATIAVTAFAVTDHDLRGLVPLGAALAGGLAVVLLMARSLIGPPEPDGPGRTAPRPKTRHSSAELDRRLTEIT